MISSRKPSLLYIVGPTATGKTRLALSLAKQLGGEIVNSDSRQVYRYMDIGTAKPTPGQRAQVPHHLFDLLTPAENFSLGQFLILARSAIDDITRRNSLAIVVGGTGQYIRALQEGWEVPAVPPDEDYRTELEAQAAKRGSHFLYQELQRIDPRRAAELDARNLRRIVRALEIHHSTGQVPSETRAESAQELAGPIIGLTMARSLLYDLIDRRVDQMMASGFLEEASNLLQLGFNLGEGPLACPGYKELGQYLAGKISLDEAVQRAKYQTHRLARRQYTWFKPGDSRINWLNALEPGLASTALSLVSRPP